MRRARTDWFALGALAVAGVAFAVIAAGGIGENLVYYWAPDRAARGRRQGRTARRSASAAMVAPGSIQHGPAARASSST